MFRNKIIHFLNRPYIIRQYLFQSHIIIKKAQYVESVCQIVSKHVIKLHSVFSGSDDDDVLGIIPFATIDFDKDTHQNPP